MTTATDEITAALLRDPPEIPSHYGYDAAGSEFYAAIMKLDDYYLPAAETSILTQYSGDIMTHASPTTLIDLGAGTAEKPNTYWPPLQTLNHPRYRAVSF